MNGKILALRRIASTTALLAALLLPAMAGASTWCGENGLIRFSFVEGDSLVTVLHTGESDGDVTIFDLYAWLADVEPVALDGEAFLHVGGFEFKLAITGAEASILEQEFPETSVNVGKKMGHVAVGLDPGERIRDGKVRLVRWKILIKGRPENIRIGLDPAGLKFGPDTGDFSVARTSALYVGSESSMQVGLMCGAGYAPSWINPVGDPDQTPITGEGTWRKVGVFKER